MKLDSALVTSCRSLALLVFLGGMALPQVAHGGALERLHADGFEQPALTVSYPQSAYAFELEQPITAQAPTVSGTAASFSVQPALPLGLVLDPVTGILSGAAQSPQSPLLYRIEASGTTANAAVFITIEVRDAVCGDGFVAGAEACDDGNFSAGDGCSLSCTAEFGWSCAAGACSLDPAVESVGLGGFAGCVLRADGELGCFGRNRRGEAGAEPAGTQVDLPRQVEGIGTSTAFALGDEHACSLDSVGNVWCWGDNSDRQLGSAADGLSFSAAPVLVGALPVVVRIAAGDDFNCVVDVAGITRCWGDNDNRQLGRGDDTADSPIPVPVAMPGGLATLELALGADHACALLADATVACWGDDDNGQLGDGQAGADSGTPTRIPALTDIRAIAAGGDSSCAVDASGSVFCWGDNVAGQLGIGSSIDQPTPQPVTLPAPVRALDLGNDFACALLVDESVYCWGRGASFRLASGNILNLTTPSPINGLPPGPWRDITLGGGGVCLLGEDARRWCWGDGESGQLGLATRSQIEPASLQFSGSLQSLVLARPEYRGVICGVLVDGRVECAGNGTVVSSSPSTGALGLFEPVRSHIALPESRAQLADVRQMEIGFGFACVATSSDVRCWGSNSRLQLGQGGSSTADRLDPLPVVGLAAVDEIALGSQHACARLGGTVRCWGNNASLQTGQGGEQLQPEPAGVRRRARRRNPARLGVWAQLCTEAGRRRRVLGLRQQRSARRWGRHQRQHRSAGAGGRASRAGLAACLRPEPCLRAGGRRGVLLGWGVLGQPGTRQPDRQPRGYTGAGPGWNFETGSRLELHLCAGCARRDVLLGLLTGWTPRRGRPGAERPRQAYVSGAVRTCRWADRRRGGRQ